jgi:hypothetical protein
MPVSPPTQEADIRGFMVQRQPQTNSSRNPILKKKPIIKRGWWSGSNGKSSF